MFCGDTPNVIAIGKMFVEASPLGLLHHPFVHVGPFWTFLEYSGTFRYPTKIFRYLRKPLSLYESYSLDHSGTPRDVRDPIRDSESSFVYFIIHLIAKPNSIGALSV